MSALVKAQLLKHLSKFVKNLSADHLSLKLLQGAGDIENIDLNEVLIGSTLGLPPWLRLTRIHCNRMSIRLHWTRLTSEPIQVALDVVYVDIEAAEPTANPSAQDKKDQSSNTATLNSFRMPYGFINKAVDGISISINTIRVQFKAGTFLASLELSHVTLQSCLPDWSKDIKHLKNTRIKNAVLQQVLLFKLAKCNTLRLETTELQPETGANLQTGQPKQKLTPFRIIINRLITKIQFKRSLTDSSVLCTKLNVEIDDILSVLTDAQAQVGLRFINHLQKLSAGSSVELAAKRAALARTLAASMNVAETQPATASGNKQNTAEHVDVTTTQAYHKAHAYFINHDFTEHSTHVKLARIDLHLVAERASSCTNKEALKMLDPILLEGAVRISLENLSFNLYPAHVLGSECKGWPRYQRLFRTDRANLEAFQGCFEAIGYGSIDAVKLYAANLPHEHNPNQLCISICGARKWPAIYFDSSQVVSEKDLSIVDSRNAVRVSRINVNFHLPTLLYLIVMVEDARELFKISEELDIGSSANRFTKVELAELDLVYQPQMPKQAQTPGDKSSGAGRNDDFSSQPPNNSRPVILLSVANVRGQLVQRPESALTEATFSESAEVSESELYAFLHSFLAPDQELAADEFERKCFACCSEIEVSRRHLWHWEFSNIFARTVTATDGDIPLLYLPKVIGFMPHNLSSYKMYAMLKCDPIEGPIQVFAERAQFDELQEMLQVFQNFASTIQRSLKILACLAEQKLIESASSQMPPQMSHIIFLAPLISMRLLLPAVPPLVVPIMNSTSTQTGGVDQSYSLMNDSISSARSHIDIFKSTHQQFHRHSLPNESSEEERPLIQSSGLHPTNPFSTPVQGDELIPGSVTDLFSTMQSSSAIEDSPSRSALAETQSQFNASLEDVSTTASNTLTSSSSEDIVDFVVVKSDDPLDEDDDVDGDNQNLCNPLDPSSMNFGLQGGQQEVVSVQIVIEGLTASIESFGDGSMPKIELRFDRISPINKPRVLPRRDVYFPLDLPVSFNDHHETKLKRRQFKATITEAPDSIDGETPRQCINFWLAPDDALPPVSMSAINALAHFLSPDAPLTDVTTAPPIINIFSSSNAFFSLKMDTPNVFDHLPQDIIHFTPPPTLDDKRMFVKLAGCPLIITQDGFNVAISPASKEKQIQDLQSEVSRLLAENASLKARLDGNIS